MLVHDFLELQNRTAREGLALLEGSGSGGGSGKGGGRGETGAAAAVAAASGRRLRWSIAGATLVLASALLGAAYVASSGELPLAPVARRRYRRRVSAARALALSEGPERGPERGRRHGAGPAPTAPIAPSVPAPDHCRLPEGERDAPPASVRTGAGTGVERR